MHCKDVSFREVDFPLTEENIARMFGSWSAYTRTEEMVLINGSDHATVRIEKEKGTGLFRPVVSFEIVSLPDNTDLIEDHALDVLNVPAMARIQAGHPGRAVVVKGMFDHVSFVFGLEPVRLRVIDSVPPSPSKLSVLVQKALDSGFVEHPIIQECVDVDMAVLSKDVTSGPIMFPCAVSGLKSSVPVSYLDSAPDADADVTLVGCHLSKRIFESLYGFEPRFINTCPADYAPNDGVKTITKCCKVKNGHRMEGDLVSVPWGATIPEVAEALNALFAEE
ncbi:hypothetical protein AOA81_06450 [Methanomassiliicoccales archaeon RumEn M2]|nr:hypothetical protein AOA81_06450 [Methanomassiliicoccales archaeon RumEn M2]